jgi:hypothetical protein
VEGDVREQGMCSEIDLPVLLRSYAHCVDFLGRCLTDQALSCRPPVKVPRPARRAPAEATPNRAAAGWKARQSGQMAAGQLQCLVRPRARPTERRSCE